jgi:hypothetical protein
MTIRANHLSANTPGPNFSQLQHRHASLAFIPQPLVTPPSKVSRTQTSISAFQAPLSSSQNVPFIAPQAEPRANIYMPPPINMETSNIPSLSSSGPRRPNIEMLVVPPDFGPESQAVRSIYPTTQPANPIIQDLQKQISLPSSSPPTSSASASNNLSLHATSTDSNSDAILSSLQESSDLYDLPLATLEKLVGDVVREDGFAKLVRFLTYDSDRKLLMDTYVRWRTLHQCGKSKGMWVYEIERRCHIAFKNISQTLMYTELVKKHVDVVVNGHFDLYHACFMKSSSVHPYCFLSLFAKFFNIMGWRVGSGCAANTGES